MRTLQSDLAVIGGGPVGSVTALYAVRAGLSVVVLEPRPAPIDKACGEGLMPSAVERLGDLGLHPDGREFMGITYLGERGRSVSAAFPGSPGLGVRRTVLHDLLWAALRDSGAPVVPAAAEHLQLTPEGVAIRAGDVVLKARYVVAADGLHSRVRARLGLTGPSSLPRRYGLRRHWRVRPWSRHVEVHWTRCAEAYVTPVGEDLVGVAILTSTRGRSYESWLSDFGGLWPRLRHSEPASDVRGAGPLEQRTRRRTLGRALLVGDAAGYLDALTGEGLGVGLRCAEAAVAAVLAGDPMLYERRWQEITAPSWGLTEALVRATQVPSLRRALVPAAASVPVAFRRAVASLA